MEKLKLDSTSNMRNSLRNDALNHVRLIEQLDFYPVMVDMDIRIAAS